MADETPVLLQRFIVRIIFMVPVYAVSSFLSLIFPEDAIYFDTVRVWCVPQPGGPQHPAHPLQGIHTLQLTVHEANRELTGIPRWRAATRRS